MKGLISDEVEIIRITASKQIDSKTRGTLGQFFTPQRISDFMASLFQNISGEVKLLDPGSGIGSLMASFVDEAIKRDEISSFDAICYDVDKSFKGFFEKTSEICKEKLGKLNIDSTIILKSTDFVIDGAKLIGEKNFFNNDEDLFTHVIINPPYKKINSDSVHRKSLRAVDIETVNLYSGFVALAIKLLKPKGEMVAIIPRSFCNGPYYQNFREILLTETAVKDIHIFESRNNAFSDDEVLQENVIIHCIKGAKQSKINVTSSKVADFHIDIESGTYTASDMTLKLSEFKDIVKPNDKNKFIHIATNSADQKIVDRLSYFDCPISDLDLEVSTGPVVDFRMTEHLGDKPTKNFVPLIYQINSNGTVQFPITRKPNYIEINKETMSSLWDNSNFYVITRRFSSKEERRRIVAAIFNDKGGRGLIGFDNKLNVYHRSKSGFGELMAKGLFIYLNSTLLDNYYRQFGGHTQVNATDLRSINYPSKSSLERMGAKIKGEELQQRTIDEIIEKEIKRMSNDNSIDPLLLQDKITEATAILTEVGMPRAQINERSALTLLALADLSPEKEWKSVERPLIGVTPIMLWCESEYGKKYAPNTRETFRRQTLHQFIEAGISLINPDDLARTVNSPKTCYQLTQEFYDLISSYKTKQWVVNIEAYLKKSATLKDKYAKQREMQLIPLTIGGGIEIKLSPGDHSQLISEIILDFGPRFAPGCEVVYIGDTGNKLNHFNRKLLKSLNVIVDDHGKMPDVVLYDKNKNWLFLIESVTSHGPVDSKRHSELSSLFKSSKAELVYVTAFLTKRAMTKYLQDISWETEVWFADAPSHMIHFNGDKFLGPHKK